MSRAVYDLVGQTEEKNVIDKIVAYLKRNGGRATQRETARAIKIKSKELAEYLSTMLEYGMIDRREKDNGGKGRNQVYLFLREANDTNVSKVSNVTNVTNVPDKECVMDSPGTLVTLVPLVTKETLEPIKRESNPEIDRIRAGHQKHVARKRTCCLCGRTFPYDLTYHANGDKSGYECTTCLMHGPPPEPEKANPQTKLEASG
jgi:DNA-binding HxlR family transcriptional regulator